MNKIEWQKLNFDSAVIDITAQASKVDQGRFEESGKYPIVDQGQGLIAGYIDDESLIWKSDLPVIIFGDHTRTIKYVNFPFVLGADGAKVLKPIPDIDPYFAYFSLLYTAIPPAGYSRHFKFLRESIVRFPPFPEQQRIARLLGKADRLRRLRRYALEMSERYLQAVFVEMFGEYQQEQATRLGEIVTITGGGTPSREVSAYFQGQIPWLTSKDMKSHCIWDTQEHITEEAIRNSATKLVPIGSILVVVKSKILMHRLPLAITKVPLCHGQDIKSIQCHKNFEPEFVLHTLKYNEDRLLNQARGANTEGLTLPMLEEVPIPEVPFIMQQKFAQTAHKYERLRNQQREALRQAEHLFQTLLQQAFAPPTA